MARTGLMQLSIVLYGTFLCVSKVSSQDVISQSNYIRYPDLTATNCSLGPLMKIISCEGLGLRYVPHDLFPGVEELDITGNKIKVLSNSSFSPYRRLKKLSLYSNDIEEIAIGSFHSMPDLEYLELGNNKRLKRITSEMFKISTKLAYLSLYMDMTFQFLPSDILRWLPNLQILKLGMTMISNINITTCSSEFRELNIYLENSWISSITNRTFRIDCELNSLYLRPLPNMPISMIDPHTVATIRSRIFSFSHVIQECMSQELWQRFFIGIGNSEIKELLLQNTDIGDIAPHFFIPLQNKTLQVLDLSSNSLPNITKKGFLDLPFLHELVLDGCQIEVIHPTDFTRMKGLRILRLNFNQIREIGDYDSQAKWDIDLEELYLVSNNLHSIHSKSFEGLTNLKILVLSENTNLQFLFIPDISGLRSLEYLNLTKCCLEIMQINIPNLQTFILDDCGVDLFLDYRDFDVMFNNSRFIKNLSLQNDDIISFLYPFEETTVSLFKGLRSLTTLDVKNNPIKRLQSGVFADLISLKQLDLSHCKLVEIEYKTFEGLQHLQNLYLQGNKLHDLPYGVFQNTGQLATIQLADNVLRYLERDLFVKSSKLVNLTLSGNRLSGFNRSTFEPIMNTLLAIDISDNELVCTCNLKWLPMWLAGSIKLLNENGTRCSSASLEELRESPVMSFQPAALCGPNIALYCSLSLVITWIVVIGIFAYHHRWFLKHKLFLLKLVLIGYREIQDDRDFDDFQFHFNIMFAEEDEEWVNNHLRPVLQEQLPEYNRNVYGDNDLPLGMHYCDAVHYVVEMSYKTIIVVSRAAIQDNWFVIKFRTAADQVNDTQVENMVVIFLEDIPDDELPYLVRLYLSDRNPYLSWEEDEGFQEYFWQKIIKMVTINLRVNNVIPPE